MSTRVRMSHRGGGEFVGTITIGCDDCGGVGDLGHGESIITIGAIGESKADALHKAALLAERIVDDPIMRAIMPPQAQAAIVATKKLASAAKRGRRALRAVFGRLRGKGKKRVARALMREQAKRLGVRRVRPMPMPRDPEPESFDADEAMMNPPPPPEPAPVPEDALGPMPIPSDDEGV